MKIDIVGLSLQTKTLHPIMVLKTVDTKERYSIILPLEEAAKLAGIFHAKDSGSIETLKHITKEFLPLPKNIEQVSLVFSPEGLLISEMQVKSWFRKKHIVSSLSLGVALSLHYSIPVYINKKMLQQLEKTNKAELQRTIDNTLYSLETALMYDSIASEKTLLGMKPETTLIM